MRVVLVLCLLAFISCQKDIIDIVKCLYESPKVKELIADALIAIATQDFSKLWPKIKEALPELIKIVIKCVIAEEKSEVNLKNSFVRPPQYILDYVTGCPDYNTCYSRCLKYLKSFEGYCFMICENKKR